MEYQNHSCVGFMDASATSVRVAKWGFVSPEEEKAREAETITKFTVSLIEIHLHLIIGSRLASRRVAPRRPIGKALCRIRPD